MVTRNKVRCAIRVDEEVYRVAQERSKRREMSLAEVLADAARKHLLGHKADEHALLGMVQQLAEFEHREHAKTSFELHVVKEMLGLFVLTFYRIVPAPVDAQRAQAERESLVRYDQFMEELAHQIRDRKSTLEELMALQNSSARSDSTPLAAPTNTESQAAHATPVVRPEAAAAASSRSNPREDPKAPRDTTQHSDHTPGLFDSKGQGS